jgi:predicted exporter
LATVVLANNVPKDPAAEVEDGSTVVRLLGAGCFLAALGVLFWVPAGCTGASTSACPVYSFNEPWILKGERAAIVLVVAILVVALLWYTLVKGQLPTTFGISTASLTYAQQESSKATEQLKRQLEEAQRETTSSIRGVVEIYEQLNKRVHHLEQDG